MRFIVRVRNLVILGVLLVGIGGAYLYRATGSRHEGVNSDAILDFSAERCKARGGEVVPVCRAHVSKCIVQYPDAGKICIHSSQCLGGCFMDLEKMCQKNGAKCFGPDGPPKVGDRASGFCRADNNPCGNFWKVDDGKVVSTSNVD